MHIAAVLLTGAGLPAIVILLAAIVSLVYIVPLTIVVLAAVVHLHLPPFPQNGFSRQGKIVPA